MLVCSTFLCIHTVYSIFCYSCEKSFFLLQFLEQVPLLKYSVPQFDTRMETYCNHERRKQKKKLERQDTDILARSLSSPKAEAPKESTSKKRPVAAVAEADDGSYHYATGDQISMLDGKGETLCHGRCV